MLAMTFAIAVAEGGFGDAQRVAVQVGVFVLRRPGPGADFSIVSARADSPVVPLCELLRCR